MASLHNCILGLDIGDSKICAVVCEVDAKREVHLRGVGTSISSGLSKTGTIEDPEELCRSVDRAIRRATRDAAIKPTRVITNIPVYQMQFVRSVGVVLSKETSGCISESDRVECIRRTQHVSKSTDQKVVHIIPLVYRVDGQVVENPVGVSGHNLEVETLVVLAPEETVRLLTHVLKNLQLHISGIMYDGIATGQIMLTRQERQAGSVLCDIGGRYTKVSVYKDNILCHAGIIPIGGETFSRDVAQCLKVTLPEAERLKILNGDVLLNRVNAQDVIEITTQDIGRRAIKKLLVCQILEARLAELIRLTRKSFPEVFESKYQFVVSGGGAQLPGIAEYIENHFTIPVRDGLPDEMAGALDDPHFATAIGLVLYAVRIKAVDYVASPRLAMLGQVKSLFRALFN